MRHHHAFHPDFQGVVRGGLARGRRSDRPCAPAGARRCDGRVHQAAAPPTAELGLPAVLPRNTPASSHPLPDVRLLGRGDAAGRGMVPQGVAGAAAGDYDGGASGGDGDGGVQRGVHFSGPEAQQNGDAAGRAAVFEIANHDGARHAQEGAGRSGRAPGVWENLGLKGAKRVETAVVRQVLVSASEIIPCDMFMPLAEGTKTAVPAVQLMTQLLVLPCSVM